jgi:hypothetical protein
VLAHDPLLRVFPSGWDGAFGIGRNTPGATHNQPGREDRVTSRLLKREAAVRLIDRWLRARSEGGDGLLAIATLVPDGGLSDDVLLSDLGNDLRRNYISPSEVAVVLEALGVERLAAHIRTN